MTENAQIAVVESYAAGLEEQAARSDRTRRRCNWAAAVLAVLACAAVIWGDMIGDESWDTLGGFLVIVAAITGIAGQMAGSAAQRLRLEREEASPAFAAGDDPAELRFLVASLPLRRTRRIVRGRHFRNSVAAVLFIGMGLGASLWFLILIAEFLDPSQLLLEDAAAFEEFRSEALVLGLIAAVLTGWGVTRMQTAQELARENERLEVELELIRYGDSPEAARARKLFLLNHRDLQKYYIANRFSSRFALLVSLFCVAAGLGLTVWTMLLVIEAAGDASRSQALVAGIGAANAVMVNVVAAVVLRVHSTVSSNVNSFHERLVRTHEAFLSNVIAAEIDDPVARRETLSRIATVIGRAGRRRGSRVGREEGRVRKSGAGPPAGRINRHAPPGCLRGLRRARPSRSPGSPRPRAAGSLRTCRRAPGAGRRGAPPASAIAAPTPRRARRRATAACRAGSGSRTAPPR